MRHGLMVMFLFALFAAPTFAEDSTPDSTQFRSFINGITCGQIVDGLDKEKTRNAYVLMVGSFITGTNYVRNRDSRIDLQGMLQLTEQFCRQNPDHPVLTAMVFLDKAIDKRDSVEQ